MELNKHKLLAISKTSETQNESCTQTQIGSKALESKHEIQQQNMDKSFDKDGIFSAYLQEYDQRKKLERLSKFPTLRRLKNTGNPFFLKRETER